jgi:hypothetical protein
VSTTIIGVVNKGFVMPKHEVTRILKTHNQSSSIVVANDSLIEFSHFDRSLKQEEVETIMEQLKDVTFGYAFHNVKPSVESLQPFTLAKNTDEKAVIVGLIAGSFPCPEKSAHTPEYHFFQKLVKKTHRLYHSNPTMKQLMEVLDDKDGEFREDVANMLPPNGSLLIMNYDGVFLPYLGSTAAGHEFDWGAISAVAEEAKAEEKVTEKPKAKGGLLSGLLPKLTSEPPTAPVAPPTEPPKADPVVEPSKVETAPVPANATEFILWNPKPGVTKDKLINRMFNDKLGCVPVEAVALYKKGTPFPVPVTKPGAAQMKFGSQRGYEAFKAACLASKTNYVESSVLHSPPPTLPKDDKATPAAEEPNVSYVVPAEGKKHFNEVFKTRPSVMTANSDGKVEVLNPKVLSKLDNKASTDFATQSGVKGGVNQCLGWDETDIQAFLKDEDPTLVFLFVRDLMIEAIALKAGGVKKAEAEEAIPPKKTGLLAGLKLAS